MPTPTRPSRPIPVSKPAPSEQTPLTYGCAVNGGTFVGFARDPETGEFDKSKAIVRDEDGKTTEVAPSSLTVASPHAAEEKG